MKLLGKRIRVALLRAGAISLRPGGDLRRQLLAIRRVKRHATEGLCYCTSAVWLWEEQRSSGERNILPGQISRGDNDLNRRPAVTNAGGKLRPVHAARHFNVGKDNPDIVAALQNAYRLVGVTRFDCLESGVLNNSHRHKSLDWFIFHHQHDRL